MKHTRIDATHNYNRILKTLTHLSDNNIDITKLTMSEVAKRSGVGVGTVYRHFDSKSKLYEAVMNQKVVLMFKNINKLLIESSQSSVRNRLFSIFTELLTLREENSQILAFIEKTSSNSNALINVPFYNDLATLVYSELIKVQVKDVDFKVSVMLNCFSSDFYYFEKKNKNLSKHEFINKVLDNML